MDFSLLDQPYALTTDQIAFYQKNKFIKLKHVLSEELLKYFNQEISRIVISMSKDHIPIDQRDTYGKAFLQLMNLWVDNHEIRPLICSARIAQIATELLQVKGVRMYHDQALYKEAGGGITPWHADQYYWPLDTDRTVTAWIPLQKTPLEMGPLEFSSGSHAITAGRDLMIGDESETVINKTLKVTDFEHVIEPFDAGEISFHSGWIFHRAGANTTDEVRRAMTIIYMDKDMVLKQPENENQIADWHTWCPGAVIGQVINSPLNPVLYSQSESN